MSNSGKTAGIAIILLLVVAAVVMTRGMVGGGGHGQQPSTVGTGQGASGGVDVPRITVQEVKSKLDSGAHIVLVCAYDDARADQMKVQGAISVKELRARLPSLPRDTEIVTY